MFHFHFACELSKEAEADKATRKGERDIKSPMVARDFHENSNKII